MAVFSNRCTCVLFCTISLLAGGLLACDRGGGSEAPESGDAAAVADPFDATARRFLASLGSGDYGDTMGRSAPPLSGELTKAAYDDLTEVVAGLGEIQQMEVLEKRPVQGGQFRRYRVRFDEGLVEYEVTVEYQAVVGFHLAGPGFEAAQDGVIAERYEEFEVYEFHWRLEDGSENPDEEVYTSNRVDWQALVGGLAARGGEHLLSVSVMLLDEDGKKLFKAPIRYDVRFGANEQGIPTGNVDGNLEVPGPGKYGVEIHIQDNVAGATIDHREDFEVRAE